MLAALAALIAGVIGFVVGTSRVPSAVLVPDDPTTLHLYRFEPNGVVPKPGDGEKVIFDAQAVARVASELNRLPAFPRFGRTCDSALATYLLSFSYKNGDGLTVEIRPSPCGMVTAYGDRSARADALGSSVLDEVTKSLQ